MQGLSRAGVIRVSGKSFAVGLFWQTAEVAKNAVKEARVAARQEADRADLYCIREGFLTQWGIGWTKAGHRAGMPIAAAALAEELAGNWLGVFRTDAGWWFVAARRDAVLPDGDTLYDNEDEPRTRFEMEFGRGGWDRVFTPAEWGVGGDTTQLPDLIGASAATVRMKPVGGLVGQLIPDFTDPRTRRNATYVIAAGVLGVLGYVGWTAIKPVVFPDPLPIPPTPRPDFASCQQNPNQLGCGTITPQQAPVAPWAIEPVPSVFVATCMNSLQPISIHIPGWQFVNMSCSRAGNQKVQGGDTQAMITASVTWSRAGGTVQIANGYFDQLRRRYSQVSRSYDLNGENVTASITTGVPAKVLQGSTELFSELVWGDKSSAWPRETIKHAIWTMSQDLTIPVRLVDPPPPPQFQPGQAQATNVPPPPPPSISINYTTNVPPNAWGRELNKINAFVFESISFDNKGGSWDYKGKIYEYAPQQQIALAPAAP